jgi:hypothetical protein
MPGEKWCRPPILFAVSRALKRVPLVSGFFITPELGIAGDKDEGAVGMRLDAARQIAAAPVTQRRCVAR